ncbi:O-Antigen ligase [Meiothermus luteus]|jgi:O-antigen ligase|uniref:O-Antigen ligase n=1 Tax=Meiothermus luteus TaxID=2026184 RepID=A0A399EY34_9DEIN|nr:O-antigen ligase family protein [Meiothermus luteus]RIH89504.1 O-Antigen ligase [Meiothermus luteus]RMH55129.1 MAG: hypothetical protein D6684_08255 [Deinococcota bacterium]
MTGRVFLHQWWWPIYAAIYVLLFYPTFLVNPGASLGNVLSDGYLVRAYVTVFFLGVGFLLEWSVHSDLRLRDARRLPQALRQHPAVALALLYGFWSLIAAFFTLEPIAALTGSFFGSGDGAFFGLALVGVFVLVYLQTLRDPGLPQRLAWSVVLSGVLMASLAIIEIATRQGVFYPIHPASLPMVTFPQKGHLAGFFVLVVGILLGFLRQSSGVVIPALFVLSIALGATYNRAALLAVSIGGLWLAGKWRQMLVAALIVCLGLSIGWLMVRTLNSEGERQLTNNTTAQTRYYIWKAAIGGILERPLTGWGAGQFDTIWPRFLSKEELDKYAQMEWGVKRVKDVFLTPKASPVLLVEQTDGTVAIKGISVWKAHNQFLDIALLRGLVGLLCYLALFWYVFRSVHIFPPLAMGLIAYHAFLFLWFAPFHIEGTLWAVLGGACATGSLLGRKTDNI